MTHGIASWKKKEGEFVAAGDILAEIQTDKATMEMESMEEGWVAKVLVPGRRGDIPVGKPVAVLCEEQADVAAFATTHPPRPPPPPPRRPPRTPPQRARCWSDRITAPSASEAFR